jgi:PAS domain S-box-containing protein
VDRRRRTVGILLFDDVEVLDFSGPFEVFFAARLEGQDDDDPALFDVVTIAQEKRLVRSSGGLLVQPGYTLDDHPPLDILVVPGGDGTRRELRNRRLLDWIVLQNERTETTMSVCTGALMLAECGILDGLEATTHWGRVDWMRVQYPAVAMLNHVRLVDNGHVVTSAGISAGIDLALHVVERLHGAGPAAWTARRMEHLWSEQYRSVFESSADAIVIVDPQGHIAETNTTACRLFGYGRDEMVGMRVSTLASAEFVDEVEAHVRAVPHAGSGELRLDSQRKDGSRFQAELRSTSFEYHGVPHVLSMVRDITARVEAEQAVLEERLRLSRELHDSVSQALYGIVLGAETARAMVDRDPSRAGDPLDYVVSLAKTGLAEMRGLIFELRPETVEHEGLADLLQKQADAFAVRHRVQVTTVLCDEPVGPAKTKEALYRIAQEALHNTVKHAGATAIHLSLQRDGEEIILAVRDNGKGFDTSGSYPGHLGLHTMRERAEEVGGVLQIASAAGAGTTISVRTPSRSHESPP